MLGLHFRAKRREPSDGSATMFANGDGGAILASALVPCCAVAALVLAGFLESIRCDQRGFKVGAVVACLVVSHVSPSCVIVCACYSTLAHLLSSVDLKHVGDEILVDVHVVVDLTDRESLVTQDSADFPDLRLLMHQSLGHLVCDHLRVVSHLTQSPCPVSSFCPQAACMP